MKLGYGIFQGWMMAARGASLRRILCPRAGNAGILAALFAWPIFHARRRKRCDSLPILNLRRPYGERMLIGCASGSPKYVSVPTVP
jgi:hypothetical protein